MSHYTTEVRYICEDASGLIESKGYNDIEEILNKAIPKIFNFNFPIFDENYRAVLERKILKHFYTREIGEETVGLWKYRLDTKLNEIMPYYNQLYNSELLEFNPLYTVNLNTIRENEGVSDKTENENISDITKSDSNVAKNNNTVVSSETENKASSKQTGKGNDVTVGGESMESSGSEKGAGSNVKWDIYSDTPQGALTNVENETYLTNARKIIDEGNDMTSSHNISSNNNSVTSSNSQTDSTDNSTNISNGITTGDEKVIGNNTTAFGRNRGSFDRTNTTENYLEHIVGYNGTNASKLLQDFRETFLNIDMMIIKDLEVLFMQLW